MRFATSNEIRLNSDRVTRVSAKEPFSLAVSYPTGWFKQSTVFELTDFGGDNKDTILLLDALGIVPAERIQFDSSPSHLHAVASFKEGFLIEMYVNTVDYIVGKGPEGSAFYLPGKQMPLFITKSGTEYYKNLLRKSTTFIVSPEAYEQYDETSIEATVALVRDILISFWFDVPGFTDGPDKGSSLEEIKAYLDSRKK